MREREKEKIRWGEGVKGMGEGVNRMINRRKKSVYLGTPGNLNI